MEEAKDAQGKVLQAKFAWAGRIVKGLAPKALGAKSRTRRPSSRNKMQKKTLKIYSR